MKDVMELAMHVDKILRRANDLYIESPDFSHQQIQSVELSLGVPDLLVGLASDRANTGPTSGVITVF